MSATVLSLAVAMREQVTAGEFESVIAAYVSRAGAALHDDDPLDLLIASMVAETGEPTTEDWVWVDAALEAGGQAYRR